MRSGGSKALFRSRTSSFSRAKASSPGIRAALPKLSQDRIVAGAGATRYRPGRGLGDGPGPGARPGCDRRPFLPAFDAYIVDGKRFSEQLAAGFAMVGTERDEMLLTFAIRPTYPATGFGYLELGEEIAPAACGGFFLSGCGDLSRSPMPPPP